EASYRGLPYANEYYDNVYIRDEATPVSVTVSQDTPNINFSLGLGGTISGTVYEEDGVAPIYNVRVQALDATTKKWVISKDTDSSGNYTLPGLAGGSYLVRAYPSYRGLPYVNEYYDNVYTQDEATPVSVTVSQDTPNINFSLEPSGSISGTVYESDNSTPIADVQVVTYDSTTRQRIKGKATDSSGNYTLAGLPVGSYWVRALASVNSLPYANEWYDDVYTRDEATPVPVTVSQDTANINFSLGPGGTISGCVYRESDNTTLSGAKVIAVGYGSMNPYGSATTNASGHYQLSSLPSGEYEVFAYATGFAREWYSENSTDIHAKEQATAVTVAVLADTPDINLSLVPGGTISGHVYQSDNTTPIISGARVYVYGSDNLTYSFGWTILDGSYETTGLLAGDYTVKVAAEGYVTEWYDDVYEQGEATPVTVTVPDDTPNINFILEYTTVTINAQPNVVPDSDFTATVDIGEVVDLNGAQYDILFDPSVLMVDNVTAGQIDSTEMPVQGFAEVSPGRYRVLQSRLTPPYTANGTGYLATLHFHVIGSVGDNSTIDLSNGTLSGWDSEIPATWIGDFVEVSVIPGDADGNYIVNILDLTSVVREILLLDAETPGADANLDGVVDVLDLTKIVRIILMLD
ncbi:carboxypeptidase regulatory-like domain-containing protein, partial [Chloroflexota bacterium]